MITVQPHHQLHVLADRIGAIAADRHHPLAIEQAEGAGDDQHGIERRPAEAAEQKGAQVLDDLEARQPVAWQPGLDQEAATHLRAIGDAHRAARGNGALVLEEGLDHAQQAVALQDGVGVDATEQAVARGIDTGIQRIGLAAVGLVDYAQVGVAARAIDGLHRLVGDGLAQRLGVRYQVEFLDEHGQGAVLGTVVDHHDLEFGVLQLQHRAHRGADRRLFVEGRHEHRHRRFDAEIRRQLAGFCALADVTHQAAHRQQVEQQVHAVEQQEIEDEGDLQPPQPVDRHRRTSAMARRRASLP